MVAITAVDFENPLAGQKDHCFVMAATALAIESIEAHWRC